MTDRTPPTEHRAPGACTSIQLQTGRLLSPLSKALGTQAHGHDPTNHCHSHSVLSEPTSVPGRVLHAGGGRCEGWDTACRGGVMHPGAGPVHSERLPQTLAEASGQNPPTQHTDGVAKTTLCRRCSAS